MEYNGDVVCHHIRNYWYEVGTKFDDCGMKFVEISMKYHLEMIKYKTFMTKYTPRPREAPPSGVFARFWSIFKHFGTAFR